MSEEGEKLGRYTLVRRIGKGGMGEVWLAKSSGAHGFEKSVALKRILPQFSQNPHVVNMLVDEARISVLLNHPNVVQVLELGEEEGDYFIAMEYVAGHALSRLLRRLKKAGKRLDILESCYIAIHLLEGLHAAHVQKDHRGKPAGIIHRDVSPQNVLLSMDGVVKVIDFGIARAKERLEVTQGTSVKGKLRYMSPEQLSPKLIKGKPIDPRVDVFAAGIVLFEMLAGRVRFAGDAEMEIMDAIVKEDTPDLAKEGLIDRELMDVLDTALEKDREQRFKDASQFAAQLRSYLYKRDPGFTAERIAKKMREHFGDDGDEEESERKEDVPAVSSVREMSSDASLMKPMHGEGDDVDATRTAFRPPVRERTAARGRTNTQGRRPQQQPQEGADGELDDRDQDQELSEARGTVARRSKEQKSRAPAVLAGVLLGGALLIGGVVFVKPRLDGTAPAPPSSSSSAAPVGASGASSLPPPPPSLPAEKPIPVRPPSDGFVDVVVEAEPATVRISLADQPDPKYVTPARIRLKKNEEVELVFEADGYETERRKLTPTSENSNVRLSLHALPVDLLIKVYPADAVLTVNGKPATKSGMKVIPGQLLEVRAEHPLATSSKVASVVPRAGENVVVELRLDEVEKASPGGHVPRGTLVITSKPTGAEVFIDGKKMRGLTPLTEGVSAGTHRITVRTGNGEQTFTLDVADGAEVKREVVLQ